jgi:uncharacterized protein (TIGR04255 family)
MPHQICWSTPLVAVRKTAQTERASHEHPSMNTTQEHLVSPHKQGQVRLHFENPPVTETSIGFYFQRIEGWNVLHQGVLWDKFRAKYPVLEVLPPILDVAPQTKFHLDLSSPIMRTGFSNHEKTQLVQIQDGLLLHNWRKTTESPEYHRYEEVRQRLREDWSIFLSYLRQTSLKDPVVSRCEVSYFNNFVRNEDWKDFSELSDIFTVWKGLPQDSYGTVQMAGFNVFYQLDSGIANIAVQPAIRSNDGKEIIQFTLTSSAPPRISEEEELFRCLDECHENARRVFVDFTTEKARERWKQSR